MRVWLTTSGPLYPNLYIFIVGHPGVGKNRVLRIARSYMLEVPDFHMGPISLTGASLVDTLSEAKRTIIRPPHEPLEYNSMTITAEELTAFMHKYDDEMIGMLSAFYDPDPYGQARRGKDLRVKIARPQLNVLSGTQPSFLMKFLPEAAWDQGFTSRVIMVFSDERHIGDDFAESAKLRALASNMIHDIKSIAKLVGEFTVTKEYRDAVNAWRKGGQLPIPNHPKLVHYNSRRKVHLYKLSMVSSLDRSDTLILTKDDFDSALGWLTEAEQTMPEIFKAGSIGADGKAIDEIYHFIKITDRGNGVSESDIINYARERLPLNSIQNVISVMEKSNLITSIGIDRMTGLRKFKPIYQANQMDDEADDDFSEEQNEEMM